MSGRIQSSFALCLILISIIAGGNAFLIYLGNINGILGAASSLSEPKFRLINEHNYSPDTALYGHYQNFTQGQFSALKTLVAYELGVDVTNIFRRKKNTFLEIVNDNQLVEGSHESFSTHHDDLVFYACRMTGRVHSSLATCLILICILAGGNAFSLYLGTINGILGATSAVSQPKLRLINEHNYPADSERYADYQNFVQGNFTALKFLVASELGIDVTNIFRRDLANTGFLEILNDYQLVEAFRELSHLNQFIYACEVPQSKLQSACF
ncbi:hypothetical protein Ddc_14807 [Ditylenchus destructor]|nr:hypothetical protein Ddc_14807 [Ditylenchus destructor]